MKNISRRSFIRNTSGLIAFSMTDFSKLHKAKMGRLSFSTLGCPDWSFDKILEFAKANSYSGIEIRGIQRELDLSKSPHFNSESSIKDTRKKLKDKGLKIVGLGSSAALHEPQGPGRVKSIDEAKRFIAIAHAVDCPYIRVFPNSFPKGEDKEVVMERMSKTLSELAGHAKGTGVKVLMETHGDLVKADDIRKVMLAVTDASNAGLVWDVSNMWSVTKETPGEVYPKIKKWVHHTHLKDLVIIDGKDQYRLFGEGEVPVFEAIDLLAKDGYDGYYSFEWEKLWHPEIAEPEVAFAQFPVKMKEHFKE
jgi:sugar phosphate isomerase/epimerase